MKSRGIFRDFYDRFCSNAGSISHFAGVFIQYRSLLVLEAMPTIKYLESCALIGQYLSSWHVTFWKHLTWSIAHSILSSLHYIHLTVQNSQILSTKLILVTVGVYDTDCFYDTHIFLRRWYHQAGRAFARGTVVLQSFTVILLVTFMFSLIPSPLFPCGERSGDIGTVFWLYRRVT